VQIEGGASMKSISPACSALMAAVVAWRAIRCVDLGDLAAASRETGSARGLVAGFLT